MEPKWSPALSTIVGIMSMGMLNMLKAQAAYWWVKGSYIPVAAMLDTAHHDKTRVYNPAVPALTLGDVLAGELVEEPGVDTAEHGLAPVRGLPQPGHVLQHPQQPHRHHLNTRRMRAF